MESGPISVVLVGRGSSSGAVIEMLAGVPRLRFVRASRPALAASLLRERPEAAVVYLPQNGRPELSTPVSELRALAPTACLTVVLLAEDAEAGRQAMGAGADSVLALPGLTQRGLLASLTRSNRTPVPEYQDALHGVLESLAEGVVLVDDVGRVRWHNPAAQQMLGRRITSPEALPTGGYFADMLGMTPMPVDDAPLERAARGESLDDVEFLVRRGGQDRWLNASVRPLPARGGVPQGGVVVMRDVTGLRVAREEAQALNQELRGQMEVQRRLLTALEASTSLKQNFLHGVSHELRTPLTVLLGFPKLMLKNLLGPLTPEQRESLERVVSAGERMHRIVESILDFQDTKLMRPPVMQAIDLRQTLRKLAARAEPLLRSPAVKLQVGCAESLPAKVQLDAQRLEHVLWALLENAVAYTESGSVRMLALQRDEQLEVSVRDTGPGITTEHHPHIFDAFYQVEPGINRARGHLGLGLASARTLAESVGGSIDFVSAPGEGSTFSLRLPMENA